MKRNISLVIVVVVLLFVGVYLFSLSSDDSGPNELLDVSTSDRVTDPSQLSQEKEDEYITVYEFDAESAEECSSVETYDAENKVCFFECDTEEECQKLLAESEAELESALDDYQEAATDKGPEPTDAPQNEDELATYTVSSGEVLSLTSGFDSDSYRSIWKQIGDISPNSLSDNYIETFIAYADEKDDTLAYIVDDDDDGKFIIAVNLPIFQSDSAKQQSLTIVHELAHIFTLNKDELTIGECEYETDEGCFGEGSILADFVYQFWPDEDVQATRDGGDVYTGYENDFVTEYASTNPEEDVAESFAYYVMRNTYGDSVAGQKQSFFNEYERAKNARSDMRKAVLGVFTRARLAQ